MRSEEINRIYDKFPPEGKNMSREEFHREMQALTDPNKIRQDIMDIQLRKARERSNRINIERGMRR